LAVPINSRPNSTSAARSTRGAPLVIPAQITGSTAIRVLNNPRYAGAYAYGRRRYRRTIDGKKALQRRDHDDWLACIPDAHPGYIT
jgi:hypothetical protein